MPGCLTVLAADMAPHPTGPCTAVSGVYCASRQRAVHGQVLRQHRLRVQDTICEPADHLSIQLEVMRRGALRLAEVGDPTTAPLAPLSAEQAGFLQQQLLVGARIQPPCDRAR